MKKLNDYVKLFSTYLLKKLRLNVVIIFYFSNIFHAALPNKMNKINLGDLGFKKMLF